MFIWRSVANYLLVFDRWHSDRHNTMIYHGNHGVLKQGNHGKTPWCFETGKQWHAIQLPYTIYEKAWSTTVYHVMSWYTMDYHVIPCNITKYHCIPWNSKGKFGQYEVFNFALATGCNEWVNSRSPTPTRQQLFTSRRNVCVRRHG